MRDLDHIYVTRLTWFSSYIIRVLRKYYLKKKGGGGGGRKKRSKKRFGRAAFLSKSNSVEWRLNQLSCSDTSGSKFPHTVFFFFSSSLFFVFLFFFLFFSSSACNRPFCSLLICALAAAQTAEIPPPSPLHSHTYKEHVFLPVLSCSHETVTSPAFSRVILTQVPLWFSYFHTGRSVSRDWGKADISSRYPGSDAQGKDGDCILQRAEGKQISNILTQIIMLFSIWGH